MLEEYPERPARDRDSVGNCKLLYSIRCQGGEDMKKMHVGRLACATMHRPDMQLSYTAENAIRSWPEQDIEITKIFLP